MEMGPQQLVVVANTRIPSQRAQSLQVMHAGQAFVDRGLSTTLLHAKRRGTTVLGQGALSTYYGLPSDSQLRVEAVSCVDGIDSVPTCLQFLPARLQEWTFASRAAKRVDAQFPDALVLTREIETAYRLKPRPGIFWEVHRVPGGRWRRGLMARAMPALAGVIAISGGVQDDLVRLGVPESKILVEHDAFHSQRFEGLPGKAAARKRLSLSADAQLVVYTGGLLAWKGVEILVQAAAQMPDVDFVIVGGMDADVKRLRGLAAGLPNVHLLGFLDPGQVPLYLVAGDVGVVPNRSQPAISSRYTSPLKVFEAMAIGLPLVVSDLPSMRDILSDEDACFVPPDDPNSLVQGLRRVFSDSKLRQRLGICLSRRAQQHTFDARAVRLLDWMQSHLPRTP
ncbi:MAG: glycosyltransferase family 4 protein [bacterium]|nr:glycosyltransferase family 4 protein [bacterium]